MIASPGESKGARGRRFPPRLLCFRLCRETKTPLCSAVAPFSAKTRFRWALARVFCPRLPRGVPRGGRSPLLCRCGVSVQREGHNRKCPSLCCVFADFCRTAKVSRARRREASIRKTINDTGDGGHVEANGALLLRLPRRRKRLLAMTRETGKDPALQ